MRPGLSRLLTLLAGAVLAFDGTALALIGWWTGRVLLILLGLVCLVAALLVVFYWKWYQKRLEEIAGLRRGLAEESRELRRFLTGK